jgi:hypothetical protein
MTWRRKQSTILSFSRASEEGMGVGETGRTGGCARFASGLPRGRPSECQARRPRFRVDACLSPPPLRTAEDQGPPYTHPH